VIARAVVLLLVGAGSSCSCSSDGENDWELVDCSAPDRDLVESGIAEAAAVEAYVSQVVADRHVGDVADFGGLLDLLVDIHARDAIRCVRPLGVEEVSWDALAARRDSSILINVESEDWSDALSHWEAGQAYGTLSGDEVVGEVAALDEEGYLAFRQTALYYLVTPATAAEMLMHEAAHLATPHCCFHEEDQIGKRDCDYVDTVGWATKRGVVWNRWVPESQWLDQVYFQLHEEE